MCVLYLKQVSFCSYFKILLGVFYTMTSGYGFMRWLVLSIWLIRWTCPVLNMSIQVIADDCTNQGFDTVIFICKIKFYKIYVFDNSRCPFVPWWWTRRKTHCVHLLPCSTWLGRKGWWYVLYFSLYNNQINARTLIGQSAVGYCAGKPTEKSRIFWIII